MRQTVHGENERYTNDRRESRGCSKIRRSSCKKAAVALMAACLCSQPAMTAFADTLLVSSGNSEEQFGPGFADVMFTPWAKQGGNYVDDQGNVIEGAILRGVSVSKWQGNIDWSKVAADDVSFAMIRMVSYGYEGEYTMDEFFDSNMRGAAANGIHTAPYIYLQTKTAEEAREAARFAVEAARNYSIDYPVAVDIESQYILDLSTQELTDVVNAFCQVIAEAGYTPIVYSDYWKFSNEMDTNQIPYDIWLARYGAGSEYANRTMWQPTDKGQVDGISGNVCLEFAFKDYASSGQAAGQETSGEQALTEGEWRQAEDGTWYFYQGENRMTGWILPDGKWYYLDPARDGAMVSNTTMVIDGTEYRFDGSGVMQ